MNITWLGWDSFKIRYNDKLIYLDPFYGEYDEVGDLILISHGHADHCDHDVLKKITKPESIIITSKSNAENVGGVGLSPRESYEFGSIKITATEAYNIKRMREPGVPFHPKDFGVGWIINIENKNLYFMGDTELVPEISTIKDIDILLIPISGKFVMNAEEAVDTVKLLKPTTTIPMHYGTIDVVFNGNPMHIELEVDPNAFAKKIKNYTNPLVLKHSESIEL